MTSLFVFLILYSVPNNSVLKYLLLNSLSLWNFISWLLGLSAGWNYVLTVWQAFFRQTPARQIYSYQWGPWFFITIWSTSFRRTQAHLVHSDLWVPWLVLTTWPAYFRQNLIQLGKKIFGRKLGNPFFCHIVGMERPTFFLKGRY